MSIGKQTNKKAGTRRWRNYLVDPSLQLQIVALSVACTIFSSALLASLASFIFTDATEGGAVSARTVLAAVGGFIVVCAVNTLVFVYWTHRLIGPTVALRRQVAALTVGDFRSRTALRSADAFHELASDLNKLADTLEARDGKAPEASEAS